MLLLCQTDAQNFIGLSMHEREHEKEVACHKVYMIILGFHFIATSVCLSYRFQTPLFLVSSQLEHVDDAADAVTRLPPRNRISTLTQISRGRRVLTCMSSNPAWISPSVRW